MSFVELAGDKARVQYKDVPDGEGWTYWYCHDEREAHAFYGKLKERADAEDRVTVAFVHVKAEDGSWRLP